MERNRVPVLLVTVVTTVVAVELTSEITLLTSVPAAGGEVLTATANITMLQDPPPIGASPPR